MEHVVCIPLPAQGHVVPMTYLARKLASEGMIVTIINVKEVHDRLQATWECIPGQDIRLESISMSFMFRSPDDYDLALRDVPEEYHYAIIDLEGPLMKLLQEINATGPSISLVISDFFHWSASHAGKKVGLRGVTWCPCSAAWVAILKHIPELLKHGTIPVGEENAHKMVDIPGLEAFEARYLPMEIGKVPSDEIVLYMQEKSKMETFFLVNGIYEMEKPTFDAMNAKLGGGFLPVGPLFPFGHANSNVPEMNLRNVNTDCLEWLDRQRPQSVLYISFGSIASISSRDFEELVHGLKSSQTNLIWVIHSNLVEEMSMEECKEIVEREIQTQAFVVRWAPQLKILQHESTGGFLTHCGWNSILESICGGVPMLGWPCLFEQNTNCKFILEDKGMGLTLSKLKTGVSRDDIQIKVQELMGNRQMMSKVKEMQSLAFSAVEPGGSSHKNFHKFVQLVNCQ